MSTDRYLVTGAMGCIGSWVIFHLLNDGAHVVAFDLSDDDRRHQLVLDAESRDRVEYVQGDLTDSKQVDRVTEGITHLIHLGALQVPFCRQNRPGGAMVNVVGTVNVFEAALRRSIGHLVYASSVAVFGTNDDYPVPVLGTDAERRPTTLYGVWKCANEAMARVYNLEDGLPSIGLIPHTVFGPGRDQGLTSQPTSAILAAVRNEDYHIDYGGTLGFQYAPDVARTFIEAARTSPEGAELFGLGGDIVTVEDFIQAITNATGATGITCGEAPLPFPHGMVGTPLHERLGTTIHTSLETAVAETAAWFRRTPADHLPLPPSA